MLFFDVNYINTGHMEIQCIAFFAVLVATATYTKAGYSGSAASSSNSVGGGQGFGYGSAGAGNFGPPPFPQFNFNNFLSQYFDSMRKYHEDIQANLQAQHNNVFSSMGYGYPGGFPAWASGGGGGGASGGSGGFGYGNNGAFASASLNPTGAHQAAGLFPENPSNPNVNVNTRIGEPPSGPGSYAVFTSSHSATSDVDGKPVTYQQASTTINDNGKVTRYTVRNP